MSRIPLGPQKKKMHGSARPRQHGKLTVIPIDVDDRLAADSQSWMTQRRKHRKRYEVKERAA